MNKNTRDKIISSASQLIAKYGYNHTGISQILKETDVPKGSFYYYFKSKEDLGAAVIEKAKNDLLNKLDDYFKKDDKTPLEKLKAYFEKIVENYDREECQSCILGNLGQELSEQHEGFRQQLSEIFVEIENFFAKIFDEAKSIEELSSDIDSQKLAESLFLYWEGSLLLVKVKKSKKPFENFLEMFFGSILK